MRIVLKCTCWACAARFRCVPMPILEERILIWQGGVRTCGFKIAVSRFH